MKAASRQKLQVCVLSAVLDIPGPPLGHDVLHHDVDCDGRDIGILGPGADKLLAIFATLPPSLENLQRAPGRIMAEATNLLDDRPRGWCWHCSARVGC